MYPLVFFVYLHSLFQFEYVKSKSSLSSLEGSYCASVQCPPSFYSIKISSAEQCGETTSLLYCRESGQKVFTHCHQRGSGADPEGIRKRKSRPQ